MPPDHRGGRRSRRCAGRPVLPHRWVDVDTDPQAEALLADLGVRPDATPVVLWRGETVLRNPSTAELARVVGLRQTDGGVVVEGRRW